MTTTLAVGAEHALTRLLELPALDGSTVALAVELLPADLRVLFDSRTPRDRHSYRPTGQTVTVEPTTDIAISQDWARVPTITRYVRRLAAGDTLKAVELGEHPDGSLFHLDGAHRMLAARLLNLPFAATVHRRA